MLILRGVRVVGIISVMSNNICYTLYRFTIYTIVIIYLTGFDSNDRF